MKPRSRQSFCSSSRSLLSSAPRTFASNRSGSSPRKNALQKHSEQSIFLGNTPNFYRAYQSFNWALTFLHFSEHVAFPIFLFGNTCVQFSERVAFQFSLFLQSRNASRRDFPFFSKTFAQPNNTSLNASHSNFPFFTKVFAHPINNSRKRVAFQVVKSLPTHQNRLQCSLNLKSYDFSPFVLVLLLWTNNNSDVDWNRLGWYWIHQSLR